MLKDFFLKEVDNGIKEAINAGTLGQMGVNDDYTLIIEKPKNTDFGDFAVNVSSLARMAKIAPPMIANAIVDKLSKENYTVSVIGGFINFKISDSMLANTIEEILKTKENYGKGKDFEKEKILLEYVSAAARKSWLNLFQQTRQVRFISVTDDGRLWEVHLQIY